MKDSEYNTITSALTTRQENILYTPGPGHVGVDYIILTWDTARTVTYINITADSRTVKYVLSENEKKQGEKRFDGLNTNTKYTFNIYNGDDWLRGTSEITTLSENIFNPVTTEDTGLTYVRLSWNNNRPADRIVISSSTGDIIINLLGTEAEKEIGGLNPETEYIFKIYTGSALRGTVIARTKTANLGNILITPTAEEIGESFVVLQWNPAAFDVTHILVSVIESVDRNVTLTADDVKEHLKKIEGLTDGTEYNFRIYNGNNLRGEITVRTNQRIPAGFVTVNLIKVSPQSNLCSFYPELYL